MTTFADAHLGDTIRLRMLVVRHDARGKSWAVPLLLITEPAPCGGPWCRALRCDALTPDGRRVILHRDGCREIDVLEFGPASECPSPTADAVAEHVDKPLVPRDPSNPAEAQMSAVDDGEYKREQGT